MSNVDKIESTVQRLRNWGKKLPRDAVEELAGQLDELADELRETAANQEVDRIKTLGGVL